MSKCLAYICNRYGVPARRGELVAFDGADAKRTEGVIVGARGRSLRVELSDKTIVNVCPTRCQYLGRGVRFEALRPAEKLALGLLGEHFTVARAAEAAGVDGETMKSTLRNARLVLGCANSLEAALKWDRSQRGMVIDGAAG